MMTDGCSIIQLSFNFQYEYNKDGYLLSPYKKK